MRDKTMSADEAEARAQKTVCARSFPPPPCDGKDKSAACFKRHTAIRNLRQAAVNEGLERAALCVLDDRSFSGLGLAAAIRALKEPSDGR